MTIRPIDVQVILGRLVELGNQQQQLQNAPVYEQVKDEQVTVRQTDEQDSQVTETQETLQNRVENDLQGQTQQQSFMQKRENTGKESLPAEEESPDLTEPGTGLFVNTKR